MSFCWKDILTLAETLKNGTTEAEYRASVGRSYYSSFCASRDHMKVFAFGEGSHDAVIKALKRSGITELRKAGSYLETLKKKRVEADYKIQPEVRQDMANYCLDLAKKVYSCLETA